MDNIIEELENILDQRKNENPTKSYVSSLYKGGNKHICDKIIEEAKELVEATKEGEDRVIYETADLFFHVLVLLASHDVKYARILEELERRFGISGIDEKNNRNK